MYILYHLPTGFAWSFAVATSCCVGLASSSRQLLRGSSDFFFSQETKQRVILPTVVDIRFEYRQARMKQDAVQVAWTVVRGAWGLFVALALYSMKSVWKLSGLG